jgi:acetolactate synthase-1/2/3 large subunit
MTIKLADYIIDFYSKKGIDKAFVVYGAANGALIDAFTRVKNIDYVCTMHEQAAGFAAEGYAKIKRLPGLAISTSGPGATNMITSIANCYYDSIPCIFLCGQINSGFMRPHENIRQIGFQETDIVEMVKGITKFSTRLNNPEDVKYVLEKSYFLATTGRQGPIVLDIPINIQKTEIEEKKLFSFQSEIWKQQFNEEDIELQVDAFLSDLEKSKRPSFLVGGGVQLSNVNDELLDIIKILKIPAFVTWNGLDSVCSDFEYYGGRVGTYGGPGRNFGIQNSDLILGVGTRISGRITGGNVSSFARAAKKYIVDLDPYLLERRYQQVPVDVNIYSDLKTFFKIMKKKINARSGSLTALRFEDWNKKVFEWREKYDPVQKSFLKSDGYTFKGEKYTHPYAFMKILSDKLSKKDIIVGDCGGCSVLVGHALKTKTGQRYHSNNGHAPMGFSFSAAIGSYIASDKKCNVVCLTGDGGFNMNPQELQTLKNYNISLKTFIINNHIYGITKSFQKTNFQGREEACGPKGYNPPDFIKVSNGYDVKTFIINNNDEIDKTIDQVLNYNGPVVCDVNCMEFHEYEPKLIGWATPIEDMYPYLDREEFKKNLFIEPLDNWKNPFMPDVVSKVDTME